MNRLQCGVLATVLFCGAAAAADVPDSAAAADATKAKLASVCDACAVVDSVKSETRKGKGGALGVVGGAVVGGLLGHQVGGGTGKTVATVGGAVAGGVAGNEIEKRMNKHTVWITRVTYKDGSVHTFETSADPGFKAGEVVQVDGKTIRKR